MSRRPAAALAAVAVAAVVLLIAFQLALHQLRGAVEQALGPRGSVASVHVGLTGIELRELRVRADRAGGPWPADDELRAARVHVVPSVQSLWRPGWHVHSLTIEGAYVSALRSRDGRLRVLPSMLDRPRERAASAEAPLVRIGEVRLRDAAIDFFDATVRRPAHRLQLTELRADLGPLKLPALDERLQIDLAAMLQGPRRDGRLTIAGHLTPSTRDAELAARLAGADLIALQPYLLRDGGVRRGTLDLKLDATVANDQLHAPGHVTLTNLEIGSTGLAGLPKQAVLAAMGSDGRIDVGFVLEGRLDDPTFSLNDTIAVQIAAAIAEVVGVSVGGVVEGVGNVIKGLFGR